MSEFEDGYYPTRENFGKPCLYWSSVRGPGFSCGYPKVEIEVINWQGCGGRINGNCLMLNRELLREAAAKSNEEIILAQSGNLTRVDFRGPQRLSSLDSYTNDSA